MDLETNDNLSKSQETESNTNTETTPYLDNAKTNEAKNNMGSSCTPWDKITLNDDGKYMCVYGTVFDSYFGGDIFYIRFSDEPNTFRFIVLNNRYFKDINGKCFQSTGKIKAFGELPYMELGDRLTPCQID